MAPHTLYRDPLQGQPRSLGLEYADGVMSPPTAGRTVFQRMQQVCAWSES
jgi:hypothetical protein